MTDRRIFFNGWFVNAAKLYELELGGEAAARQRVTEPRPVKPPENLALFGGDVGRDDQPDIREMYERTPRLIPTDHDVA